VPLHRVVRVGLGIALVSGRGFADPAPSVSGPRDGQPTREIILPGPVTKPLKAAIAVDFDGDCLEPDPLALNVSRWLAVDRIHKRVTISVTGEERPELAARFWLLVDGQRVSLRRFEAFEGSCNELGASLSAAIALAIEAVDLAEFPEPKPPPKTVLPVAKLTARADLAAEQPLAPAPRRRAGALQFASLGTQIVGGVGLTPAASVGAGVRGELGFAHGITAHAGGAYSVTETLPIAEGTLAMQLPAAQLGVCWGRDKDVYRAQGCLDVWGGALLASPSDLERQSSQVLPWVALAPGVEVVFGHGKEWGVRLAAQLSFNLVRPRFQVLFDTRDEVLDELATPPLGMMLFMGLEYNLL